MAMKVSTVKSKAQGLAGTELATQTAYIVTVVDGTYSWRVGDFVFLSADGSHIWNPRTGTYRDVSQCDTRFRRLEDGESIVITND